MARGAKYKIVYITRYIIVYKQNKFEDLKIWKFSHDINMQHYKDSMLYDIIYKSFNKIVYYET